jgi:hypothetical protein
MDGGSEQHVLAELNSLYLQSKEKVQ